MTDATDASSEVGPDGNLGREVQPEIKELWTHEPPPPLARNPNDQGDPCEQGGLRAKAALTPPARGLGARRVPETKQAAVEISRKKQKPSNRGAGGAGRGVGCHVALKSGDSKSPLPARMAGPGHGPRAGSTDTRGSPGAAASPTNGPREAKPPRSAVEWDSRRTLTDVSPRSLTLSPNPARPRR